MGIYYSLYFYNMSKFFKIKTFKKRIIESQSERSKILRMGLHISPRGLTPIRTELVPY